MHPFPYFSRRALLAKGVINPDTTATIDLANPLDSSRRISCARTLISRRSTLRTRTISVKLSGTALRMDRFRTCSW